MRAFVVLKVGRKTATQSVNLTAAVYVQVDDQINEKLLGQLICLPQTSLLVDVKDLGYDNGAVAAMDLVRQFQVRFYCHLFWSGVSSVPCCVNISLFPLLL